MAKRKAIKFCMDIAAGLIYTAGFLLMASEGALFPYANIVGAVIFSALIPLGASIEERKNNQWI